jgi:SPP1 family predicted phage head-tail adaptor
VSRTGQLRERVTIERPERAPDGAGGTSVSWVALATVWADVISFRGSQPTVAEREEARAPFRAVIRFRADVTAEMRLIWRGRRLDINGAFDPDGERRWLAIDCEERAG